MYSIVERKKVVSDLIQQIESRFSDWETGAIGTFIYFLHNFLVGLILILATIGPFGRLFDISVLIIVIIAFLHFYFNGCICIRLERHFLNDKDWCGLWGPFFDLLESIGFDTNRQFRSATFIIVGAVVILRLAIRLLHRNGK